MTNPPAHSDQNSAITIVSGLPRSGTSLMMQMLSAGGLAPLVDEQRAADESNPRGYFEFEPVKGLRTDRDWLGQAQGRVVKIIHLLLRELPTDGRYNYHVILMKRPMEEILSSQRAMLERQGKQSADAAMLEKIFRDQLQQAEEWLRSHSCFRFLPMEYHRVLDSPDGAAREIDAFLGGKMDIAAMGRAVDPALYRQRATSGSDKN